MITTSQATPLVLALLAGCLILGGSQMAAATDPGLSCKVTGTPAGGLINIEGSIASKSTLDGSYELQIRGSGPGGSSNVTQGDDFHVDAGQSTQVGEATLTRNSSIDVVMTVKAAGRTARCNAHFGDA
ncbi:MAG: curli-like amyloid fiber formation chaperone CsgH [Devosia sp.]|jgi:hypothetical protein